MSTNDTKSGSTTGIGLVGLWTVLATVFHFAEFGAFKDWPVIAWPWHWSCFCIAIWYTIVILAAILFLVIFYAVKTAKVKKSEKELDREMEVRKLVVFGKIDEAEILAKSYWPKRIPERLDTVLKAARSKQERESGTQDESNAT